MKYVFAGEVYATEKRMRRVLGVIGKHVRYSNGGNQNRTCELATFKRWLKASEALPVLTEAA